MNESFDVVPETKKPKWRPNTTNGYQGQITLSAANWNSSNSQTVWLSVMTIGDVIFLSPASIASKQAMDAANCFVECAQNGEDTGTGVTFTALGNVPTVDVTLDFHIKNGGTVV